MWIKMYYKGVGFIILAFLTLACGQQDQTSSFRVRGNLEGLGAGEVYLGYLGRTDTCHLENGEFEIAGNLTEPCIARIRVKDFPGTREFYLENSDISIHGHIDSIDDVLVTGSKTETDKLRFQKSRIQLDRKYELAAMEDEYDSATEERQEELDRKYEDYEYEVVNQQRQFIRENPGSFLSVFFLWEMDWSFQSAAEFRKYIDLLDSPLEGYESVKDLKEIIAHMESVEIGQIAPDFEMNDMDGTPWRLSDFYTRSEYLLLDFWASTCGPCRVENKNIRRAYDLYSDKGFDIVSVSTDMKKEPWLRAIEKDGLIWTNVCEIIKWGDNEIVKTYALRQVSQNFLLDHTGKIIAKDLRGEDLMAKLGELMD
jgi:thiol-disulfide isomerase/thioredoxin